MLRSHGQARFGCQIINRETGQPFRKGATHYSGCIDVEREDVVYEDSQTFFGYPACPDHTEKGLLWDLLKPNECIDLNITESFAMYPTAAVSGWYFAHPQARYFGVTNIGKDQVENYARRKGMTVAEAEKWLTPVLDYDPE